MKPNIVSKHVLMMALINKTFQHLKNEILFTVRRLILGHPLIWKWPRTKHHKFTMELHLKANAS